MDVRVEVRVELKMDGAMDGAMMVRGSGKELAGGGGASEMLGGWLCKRSYTCSLPTFPSMAPLRWGGGEGDEIRYSGFRWGRGVIGWGFGGMSACSIYVVVLQAPADVPPMVAVSPHTRCWNKDAGRTRKEI